MPEITLTATTGRATGSRPSGRLRAEGKIPAVIYGAGITPTSIAVDRRELRLALSSDVGTNAVINLDVDGVVRPTVLKDIQRDPIRRNVRHVDFLVVDLSQEIEVDVPLTITGEAPAVKAMEGMVEQPVSHVRIATTPRSIPNEIVFDVAGLSIGDTVKAGDLELPAECRLVSDPDLVMIVGAATRSTIALQQAANAAGAADGDAGADDAASDE